MDNAPICANQILSLRTAKFSSGHRKSSKSRAELIARSPLFSLHPLSAVIGFACQYRHMGMVRKLVMDHDRQACFGEHLGRVREPHSGHYHQRHPDYISEQKVGNNFVPTMGKGMGRTWSSADRSCVFTTAMERISLG